MATVKVLIVGAAGQTGSSVLNALLEDKQYNITALVRPSSASNSASDALRKKGVRVLPADILGPQEPLVEALAGIDVVISTVGPRNQLDQIPLVTAAKAAGVKRFVPCGFMTVVPPGGIMLYRDEKEEVLNHIKKLYLPFTHIDVGWWYQIGFPKLPSGRIDYAIIIPTNEIPGDGNQRSALTDVRDIGRYVAKIIADDRTLNRLVLAYNLTITPNEVYTLLEKLSGETIERNYVSGEEIQRRKEVLARDAKTNPNHILALGGLEYLNSFGIRGDNTPEYAKYLGYVTTKELYPDAKFIAFEDYLNEVLDGRAEAVYSGKSPVS